VLEYLERLPSPEEKSKPEKRPTLVLLHGRGSHMGDLQGLRGVLPPTGALITPQAPHPGAAWGYGGGWAWYRYLGDGRAEVASLEESLRELEGFLGLLPELLGSRAQPLVLGGFSQGGTTSLAYALRHPGSVDAVVNLSGFLLPQEDLGVGPEALGSTPLFWGHGTDDPAVPHALARRGRERIREAGGDMEARDYRMGHWVDPGEMEDLRRWLTTRIPGWA
jgi:phospholipase/carboxylesterase